MRYITITENELNEAKYAPLVVAFIAVKTPKGFLLIQNEESGYWELPLVPIGQLETAREAIINTPLYPYYENLDFATLCGMVFENADVSSPTNYLALYKARLSEEFKGLPDVKHTYYNLGDDLSPVCRTCQNLMQYLNQVNEEDQTL